MTTHVEHAVTEVIPEAEPAAGADAGGGDRRWAEIDQMRRSAERQRRLELRTRARGFDD